MTDDEREWLTTQMAAIIDRAGIDSYVAAPLVEANDRWFPDDWHRDAGGVERLAKRVCAHAGLGDLEVTTELGTGDKRGIIATDVDDKHMHLVVDPDHLTDALTAVAELVHLAAHVFRLRNGLVVDDVEEERRLIELTALYLGFGILLTNAAYRYRASGEMRGNTAHTRWSHDVQGALPADALAFALAMQLIARRATASELRAVKKQLETNQAEAFDAVCSELTSEHVEIALGLPERSTWPARRESPARSTALVRRKPNLPTATVKSGVALGHNTGKPVLRLEQNRAVELTMLGFLLSFVPMIALAVSGSVGPGMLAMAALSLVGLIVGRKVRRDICAGRSCGGTLPADVERCPRCGGTIAGRMLKNENLLEAEERLQLDEGDDDIDVGEPLERVADLPDARVHRDHRDGGVDGSTNTRIG